MRRNYTDSLTEAGTVLRASWKVANFIKSNNILFESFDFIHKYKFKHINSELFSRGKSMEDTKARTIEEIVRFIITSTKIYNGPTEEKIEESQDNYILRNVANYCINILLNYIILDTWIDKFYNTDFLGFKISNADHQAGYLQVGCSFITVRDNNALLCLGSDTYKYGKLDNIRFTFSFDFEGDYWELYKLSHEQALNKEFEYLNYIVSLGCTAAEERELKNNGAVDRNIKKYLDDAVSIDSDCSFNNLKQTIIDTIQEWEDNVDDN